jgi:hypothetical protein
MKFSSCYLEHLDYLGLRHENRLKSWVSGYNLCNNSHSCSENVTRTDPTKMHENGTISKCVDSLRTHTILQYHAQTTGFKYQALGWTIIVWGGDIVC